ncbi:hypothetical protein [Limibacterium fermenti]|uniref:hypothetical protein n=1 Tax=Limibacterium fermenti TaxID=3229863 RepID=UPI000E9FAFFF|nr:hypothetical protein [Porphyromonadaceae bacterium]
MKNRFILLIVGALFTTLCYSGGMPDKQKNKKESSKQKIQVEEFEDRNTGCKIRYEYYKDANGKKVKHGKFTRKWSMEKTERSLWSGSENVTATFAHDKINGPVVINCEKFKWKRKSEFIKGKGRKITFVPSEAYVAHNLRLEVKNDTLAGSFNFALGNYKYEALGSVNEMGEMKGKYTLYRLKESDDLLRDLKKGEQNWSIVEQYLCDPDYTYQDATPKITEVQLGYPGTSRGEHLHIKIPRLRLSMNSL